MEPNYLQWTESTDRFELAGLAAPAALIRSRWAAAVRARAHALLLIAWAVVSAAGCTATGTGEPGGACRTVANCVSDSAPICDSAGLVCRSCSMNNPSDDIGCRNRKAELPRCGPTGACVACLANADCAARDLRKPTCVGYTCQPCTQATDCQSNICATDGSCVPNTQVLFVDNTDGTCTGATHEGSESDPFCEISDAVQKAIDSGRQFITVRPSFRPYQPISIRGPSDSLTLEISGASPPTGTTKRVQIQSLGQAALSVASATGKQTSVTLRNVEIIGVGINSAVLCEMGASLRLNNVRIWGGKDGVTATACTLTIDGALIYNNLSNGVYLNASTFSITNAMLWANRETAIALASGNTGAIRFSTVYNNGAGTKVPGIDCGTNTQHMIDNTIIFNNERQMGGNKMLEPQVWGCTLSGVVTNDPRAMTGNLPGARYVTAIDFVDPDGLDGVGSVDLHLKKDTANNRDCCVDKSQGTTTERDIDGTRRPIGASSDIGAHEVQ